MKPEKKESLLRFIMYIGMIGVIVEILPDCMSPKASSSELDWYFDSIEWIQYGGTVLLSLAEVAIFYFLLRMNNKEKITKTTSTQLQILIAANLILCVGDAFDINDYSEKITFWDVAVFVYLVMFIVVGALYIIRRKSRIMGISMICVVFGALVTEMIANPDNHDKWIGILTALPYIGATWFFFESSKRYLIGKPFLLEEDKSSVDPSLD